MSPYGEPSSGSYSTSRGHYELRFYPKYHFDFEVNTLPVLQIEACGAPVKIRRTRIATFGLAIILVSFFLLYASLYKQLETRLQTESAQLVTNP